MSTLRAAAGPYWGLTAGRAPPHRRPGLHAARLPWEGIAAQGSRLLIPLLQRQDELGKEMQHCRCIDPCSRNSR